MRSMEAPPGMTIDAAVLSAEAAAAGATAETTAAGATTTAAMLTSTVTSTVGAVAATAAVGTAEAQLCADLDAMDKAHTASKPMPSAPVVAWDAHLDSPTDVDPEVNRLLQLTRRAALGLTSSDVTAFSDACEFVSLGCFCAASNALQLLGLKRSTYPFDWVRSSLEGIVHCVDMHFEDFLTYSTYQIQDQYVVFGGTRWGGSFWHHNIEVPMTRSDMSRRVSRFYGQGNVSACTPRFFVRVVNSTKELESAVRLRETLCRALPEASEVYLLLIVDLQVADGLMGLSGADGDGMLFYAIAEAETQFSLAQGGPQSFRLCSESYARAIACAMKHWVGEGKPEDIRFFASAKQLGAACVQFDGGDPGRELFTPRKFYGQPLQAVSGESEMEHLFARMRLQMFLLPVNLDASVPFQVEVFGKSLRISLPSGNCGGCSLHVAFNDGVLSASVFTMASGQVVQIGPTEIVEVS